MALKKHETDPAKILADIPRSRPPVGEGTDTVRDIDRKGFEALFAQVETRPRGLH